MASAEATPSAGKMNGLLKAASISAKLGSGSNGVVLSGTVPGSAVDEQVRSSGELLSREAAITSGALVPKDTFVAFKIMSHFWDESAKKLLDCERETLLYLPPHPSIIRTFAAFASGIPASVVPLLTPDMKLAMSDPALSSTYTTQCFIQEYHPTTLDTFRQVLPLPAPWHLAWRLAWDLVSVVAHMQSHRTAHLDFKADNILVAYDGRAVLTDFGISRIFESGVAGGAAKEGKQSSEHEVTPLLAVQAVDELVGAGAPAPAPAASLAAAEPAASAEADPDAIALRLPYREPFDLLMNTFVLAPEVLRAYTSAKEAWKEAKQGGNGAPPASPVTLEFTDQGMWSAGVMLYEVLTGLSHEPSYPADGGGVRDNTYSLLTVPPPPVCALQCPACAAEAEAGAHAVLRSPLALASGGEDAVDAGSASAAVSLPAPGEGVRAYLMALPAVLDPELLQGEEEEEEEEEEEGVEDANAATEGEDATGVSPSAASPEEEPKATPAAATVSAASTAAAEHTEPVCARGEEAWDAVSVASDGGSGEGGVVAPRPRRPLPPAAPPAAGAVTGIRAHVAADGSLRFVLPDLRPGAGGCPKHPSSAPLPSSSSDAAASVHPSTGGYPAEFVALLLAMLCADPAQRPRPQQALAVLASLAPRLLPVQPMRGYVAAQLEPCSWGGEGGAGSGTPPQAVAQALDAASVIVRLPDAAPAPDAAARALAFTEVVPVVCWQAPTEPEADASTGTYLVSLGDLLDTEGVACVPGRTSRRMPAGLLAERLCPVLLRRTTGECRLIFAHGTTPVDRLLEAAAGRVPGLGWEETGVDLVYGSGTGAPVPVAQGSSAAGAPFDPATVCVYVGGCEVSSAVTVASLAKYQPEDATAVGDANKSAMLGCFQPTRLPMDVDPASWSLTPSPETALPCSASTPTIPSLFPLVLDLLPAGPATCAANATYILEQMQAADAALGLAVPQGSSDDEDGEEEAEAAVSCGRCTARLDKAGWELLPRSLLPLKPTTGGLPAALQWLGAYGALNTPCASPFPPSLASARAAAALEAVHYRGMLALTAACNGALKDQGAPFPYVRAGAAAAAVNKLWCNHHEVAAACIGLARNLTCCNTLQVAEGLVTHGLLGMCVDAYFYLWPEAYEEADAALTVAAASAANEAAVLAANRRMPYQGLGTPPLLAAAEGSGTLSPPASANRALSDSKASEANDAAPASASSSPLKGAAAATPLQRIHGADYSVAEDAVLSVSNLLRFANVQQYLADAYASDPRATATLLRRTAALGVDALLRYADGFKAEESYMHFFVAAVKLLRYLTDVASKLPDAAAGASLVRLLVEEGALLSLCKCLGTVTAAMPAAPKAAATAGEPPVFTDDNPTVSVAWRELLLDSCLRTMCLMLLHDQARDVAVCPFKTCAKAVIAFMQAPAVAANATLLSLAATVLRNLACITGISTHKLLPGGGAAGSASPDKRSALLTDAVAPFTSPALILTSSGVAGILEGAMSRHPDCTALQENGRCALLNLALLGANDALEVMRQGNTAWEALEARAKAAAGAAGSSNSPAALSFSSSQLSPSLGPRTSVRLMGGLSTPGPAGTGIGGSRQDALSITLPPSATAGGASGTPRSDGSGTGSGAGEDDLVPVRRGGVSGAPFGSNDVGSRLSARFLPGIGLAAATGAASGTATTAPVAFLPTPIRAVGRTTAGAAPSSRDLPGAAAASPPKDAATPPVEPASTLATVLTGSVPVAASHVAVEVLPATATPAAAAAAAASTAAALVLCGRPLSPRALRVLLGVLLLLLAAAVAAAVAGWVR